MKKVEEVYTFTPSDITVNVADNVTSEYPVWVNITVPSDFGKTMNPPGSIGATIRLTPALADKLLSQLAACIAMYEESTGQAEDLADTLAKLRENMRKWS